MKKSLVLVALAGAMTLSAASAETVLYGSIRMGLNNERTGSIAPGKEVYHPWYAYNSGLADGAYYRPTQNWDTARSKRAFNMKDYGSRIGLRGGEDLGNGTKVLFQLEFQFDGVEGSNLSTGKAGTRLAWIGLTGDWGTFALGRQENPFANTINKNTEADDFNGLSYDSASMKAAGSTFYGAMGGDLISGASMWNRVGNSVAYVSPSFAGFSFNIAAIIDQDSGAFQKNRNVDIWTVNLAYEHESGFFAGAGVISADLQDGQKKPIVYGLKLGFRTEQWGVNATMASGTRKASGYSENAFHGTGGATWLGTNGTSPLHGDSWWGNTDNRQTHNSLKQTTFGWDVGGHFSFGADYASTVRFNVGQAKEDKKGNMSERYWNSNYNWSEKQTNKLTTWALGFEQKLSNRTKVWVEYANESTKVSFGSTDAYRHHNVRVNGKVKNEKFSIGMRHDF